MPDSNCGLLALPIDRFSREFMPDLAIGMILWDYPTSSVVDGGNAYRERGGG